MDLDDIARAIQLGPQALAPQARRQAAVAMVLRPAADGPELLMIKRSEHDGDPWSGHMAFPGGKLEEHDADGLAAAVRETREELALDLAQGRHLGQLETLEVPSRIARRPLSVSVHTFAVQGRQELVPNHEVEAVHWFGLQRFLRSEGRATFPYRFRGKPIQLPCVRLEGRLIWGMSLRMIDDLIERLPPV